MKMLSGRRKKGGFSEAVAGVSAEGGVVEGGMACETPVIKRRLADKERTGIWAIGAVVIGSFLVCRVVMMDSFLPCGIALITVLMCRDRLNVYILPAMLIGMGAYYMKGLYLWGDFAATILCAIVFTLIGNRRLGLLGRAIIAASIAVISNCAYYVAMHMLYRFSIENLLWEVFLIFGLCWVFHVFFEVTGIRMSILRGEKEKGDKLPAEVGIASISIIIGLLFCGIGVYHMALVAGLFFTLLIGYKLGIMEGILTGTAFGVVLMLATAGTPGVMVVFICGGFIAGFFKGQGKLSAAICFAATCLGLGMIREYPDLYMPIFDPLIAGAMLVAIPKIGFSALDKLTVKLVQEEDFHDYMGKERFVKLLKRYQSSFSALAGLYAAPKDSRSIVSYQFKGMNQVVDKMILDLERTEGTAAIPRYDIKMGEAGYAKEGTVSGDSYLYRELPDGKFVIILSDGMGKGEAAAVESSLAVTTIAKLLDAGFEVELALKTINSILLLKSEEEIFSTVDIALIDRVSGKLKLFKIGAAHTFIKRGEKVKAVKMAALPLGIVDGLRIDYVNVRLQAGDEIIMVSDGITDSDRDDGELSWLSDAISSIKSKDPQTMCDLILNKAVENYGVKEKDDLTVLTARID